MAKPPLTQFMRYSLFPGLCLDRSGSLDEVVIFGGERLVVREKIGIKYINNKVKLLKMGLSS
jgi:hypothetical protein